jgi:hypothetical protein
VPPLELVAGGDVRCVRAGEIADELVERAGRV